MFKSCCHMASVAPASCNCFIRTPTMVRVQPTRTISLGFDSSTSVALVSSIAIAMMRVCSSLQFTFRSGSFFLEAHHYFSFNPTVGHILRGLLPNISFNIVCFQRERFLPLAPFDVCANTSFEHLRNANSRSMGKAFGLFAECRNMKLFGSSLFFSLLYFFHVLEFSSCTLPVHWHYAHPTFGPFRSSAWASMICATNLWRG